MSVEPEFWQPKQAARYLNIHVRTLYEWISDKHRSGRKTKSVLLKPKPPFHKFSHKCIRFPVAEFQEWAKRFAINDPKGK